MPTVVETEIDSMADWLAFEAAMAAYDLVAADEIQIANINVQLSPAAEMFINSPVTDYNHYIWIRGTVYHDGRADDVSGLNNSLIDGGGYVGHTLRLLGDCFRVTDLELLNAGGTGAGSGITIESIGGATLGDIRIGRNIIHNTGSNTNANNHGVLIIGGGAAKFRAKIHNNIIYGMGGPGIRNDTSISEASVLSNGDYGMIVNNTVCYCCKAGSIAPMANIRCGSTAGTFHVLIDNNLSFNPSGSSKCYTYGDDIDGGASVANNMFAPGLVNISSDATGSTATLQNQTATDYFENAVDPASGGGQDFRLKATAPQGIGVGRYFGDPMTMDVRRAGRTIEWDCGAYETAENVVDFDAEYNYPQDFDIPRNIFRHMVRGWNEVRRALAAMRNFVFGAEQVLAMGSTHFTPTWTATTSDPTLPNGRLTGRWVAVGKRCIATYHLYLDGDEDLGAGTYRFSLPIPAQSGPPYLGMGLALHPENSSGASDAKLCRAYIPAGEQYIELRGNLDTTAWSPTVPHAWNGGDTLNFTIEYAID